MAVLGMLPILIQFLSFLLPANKVWGKVIFSEACVKNSVHRGVGGVPDQVPPLGPGRYTPPGPGRYPPRDQAGTPPPRTRQVPPWTRQVPPGTRQVHPPGPGRYTPPRDQAGTPPWDQAGTPPQNQAGTAPPDQAGTPPGPGRYPPPGPGSYTPPPRYGQHTGGMHPTGMQSCYAVFCKTRAKYEMTIKSRNAIQNKIEKE